MNTLAHAPTNTHAHQSMYMHTDTRDNFLEKNKSISDLTIIHYNILFYKIIDFI